jgi:hypothetical protein
VNDNPYQSPKSEPEVEERPKWPPNRFFYAAICGVGTLGGLLIWQWMLATLVGLRLENPLFAPSYTMLPYTMLVLFLIPGTVGLVVVSWAWRSPKSVWPVAVAGLLWGTSLAVWFIGGLFFGLP